MVDWDLELRRLMRRPLTREERVAECIESQRDWMEKHGESPSEMSHRLGITSAIVSQHIAAYGRHPSEPMVI
jgi:hypothetical protein